MDKEAIITLLTPSVKSQLKAPLSAVMCSPEELVITSVDTNGKYKVSGYVNAQNSYGAMIKTNFNYTVKENNGSYSIVGGGLENQAAKNMASYYLYGIIITIILFAFFYFMNDIIF